MADKQQLNDIALQAEHDLNTYQAKTGEARNPGLPFSGVDDKVEKRFPGAQVAVDDELNGSRAPTGAELRAATQGRDGENDADVLPRGILNKKDIVGEGKERRGNDPLDEGLSASRNNVGDNPPGPGGQKYPGDQYYRPESVPDSISAEGNIAPQSVNQASHEAENPDAYYKSPANK